MEKNHNETKENTIKTDIYSDADTQEMEHNKETADEIKEEAVKDEAVKEEADNKKEKSNFNIKGSINNIKGKLNNIDVNATKQSLKDKMETIKDGLYSAYQNTSTFKEINKLNNEKKFFGFIIIVLAVVIFIQGILNYNLITANRTIVLPPAITKEFWATDKKLSESYFEQIGFYIADRVLSVSPETVESSYISLLPFFDSNSDSLKAVREKLKAQADFVKSENLYQVFYPMKMYPYYNENKLIIEGPMKKFIGEMLVQEKNSSKIIILYEIKAGRFMIKSLDFKYNE